jgi:hypothetical protein
LVMPNDFVGINGELKRVVDVLNGDSSGLGSLVVEPPIRITNMADNPDVIFNRPFSSFILGEDHLTSAIQAPFIMGANLALFEALS